MEYKVRAFIYGKEFTFKFGDNEIESKDDLGVYLNLASGMICQAAHGETVIIREGAIENAVFVIE